MGQIIDRESLGELKSFIKDQFPKVVESYLEHSVKYVEQIEYAHRDNNAEGVSKAAHPLKSASGNLGLVALYELSRDIEEAGYDVCAGERKFEELAVLVSKIAPLYAESTKLLREEI